MSEHDSVNDAKPIAAPTGGSVVLMRRGESGCDVLLRALSARGLNPVTVHHEPDAMLALAALADYEIGRRVLIVVDLAGWQRVGELISAVRSYHGSVYCWKFDLRDGATPSLSELKFEHPVQDEDHDRSGAGPVGQIRKRTRPVDRLLVKPGGHEPTTREVVTQQELTMLLGPAPGEAG